MSYIVTVLTTAHIKGICVLVLFHSVTCELANQNVAVT